LIIINTLFPVFALIVLGNLLKHYKLTDEKFLKTSDNLIYFIFFPILLFWKIGGTSSAAGIGGDLYLAAICTIITIFFLSIISIKLFKISDYQAGSFSQSCYRFNNFIGMAIIINAMGEAGVRYFGVLIGFTIPIINIFVVSTLIWFSGKRLSLWERIRFTARAIVVNPLILGCIAGIVYSRSAGAFPVVLENTFQLMSMVTLPLALLSIGGALSFTGLKSHLKVSIIAALFKLCILPVTGYIFLKAFGVADIPFKVGMIFFALPTSTALYILSSQLNSDTELASSSIVLSTVLSFFSLSVALLI